MNMGPKGGGEDQTEDAGGGGASTQLDMVDFVLGMREAFNNTISESSTRAEEASFFRRMRERKDGEGRPESQAGKDPEGGAIRPSNYRNVVCNVEFVDRSALLASTDRVALRDAAEHICGQRLIIDVRGHVSPYESMRNQHVAMQLSYERAMADANVLVESGIPWDHLRVVAVGDHDRLVPRANNRSQDRTNQRAEIVIINEAIAADPYAAPAAKARAPSDRTERAGLYEATTDASGEAGEAGVAGVAAPQDTSAEEAVDIHEGSKDSRGHH